MPAGVPRHNATELLSSSRMESMVSELVTTAQTARLTGENDLLLARMRAHMRYAAVQVEDRVAGDRDLTTALELAHDDSLCRDALHGLRVSDGFADMPHVLVVLA